MGETPPHNGDAERIVLGTMMSAPDTIETVIDRLTSDAFHEPRHSLLYAHITAAWAAGAATDPVGLLAQLDSRDARRIGGAPYLHDCVRAVPTAAQVGHYVDIVADCAERRRLLDAAEQLSQAAMIADPAARAERVEAVRDRLDPVPAIAEQVGMALHTTPDYPSAGVPGPLGELVAASAGLPDALVGGAGLAALASVCPTAGLLVGDSWEERPILWVPLVGPRGAGKSPSLDLAFGPVRELDAQAHRLYVDELEQWREAPRRERGPRPVDPTRLVDDTTMEMLARRLAATSGAATVAPDELSGMLAGLDRYHRANGSDRARLLALWSGAPWRYMRVTDDLDILVSRPVVTIVGGIQPALHRLLGGEEDGMRPRWALHVAPLDKPGSDLAVAPTSWAQTITKLHANTSPRQWHLDTHTRRLWAEARTRWKASASGDGESASVSAALAKADIQSARIALVLAESIEPGKGGPLPPEAMTAAIALVDYIVAGWRVIGEGQTLALSRRNEVLDQAVDRLRAWLDDHGGRATRRDLMRAGVAGCRTASDLDALLARYGETYPGAVRRESPPTGGPRATVVYTPGRLTTESHR